MSEGHYSYCANCGESIYSRDNNELNRLVDLHEKELGHSFYSKREVGF